MNLDYLRRVHYGFSVAVGVLQFEPCHTFGLSHPINDLYKDEPKTEGFPNPWHIGVMNTDEYPNPTELIQGEFELLAHMYTMVLELKPKLVVETGTNVGLMTRALAAGCWANGFGRVVSSDTDERMVAYARKLCHGLPADIRHCPSLELPELKEADLVFIDSSYESRSQEVHHVKPGAVYVYHDSYAEPWIKKDMEGEKFQVHLDTPRGFSIVRKPQ